jgi:hypothetical protein
VATQLDIRADVELQSSLAAMPTRFFFFVLLFHTTGSLPPEGMYGLRIAIKNAFPLAEQPFRQKL